MRQSSIILLALSLLACALAEELYSDKYDYINIEDILQNDRLREQYYKCFTGAESCVTPDAQFFRDRLAEAFSTKCKKCTSVQKEGLDKMAEWYTTNEPEKWDALVTAVLKNAKLKSVGPKLVPFFKSVSVYFILLAEQPSLLTACFKCLPIISLIVFVLLHGISLSQEYTFSRRILTGLIFSCIGDALLVWPSCFTLGMCMFALAQIMYISAFGFIPLNIMLGTILYAMCSLVIYALMPGLNGILVIGVPVYTVLLTTMAWRAISRVQFYKELWTWTKLCSCIGSICFLISDTLLGFHYFHTPLPYSQVSIMLTYYAAQLGIALSAVGSKNSNNNNNNNVSNDKNDAALAKG